MLIVQILLILAHHRPYRLLFLVSLLKLYGKKYSYQMRVILKQNNLIHRWKRNSYYQDESIDLGMMIMKWYCALLRSPELGTRYQIQSMALLRTPICSRGSSHLSIQSVYSSDTIKHRVKWAHSFLRVLIQIGG